MFSKYKEISVNKLESLLEELSTSGKLNLNDYDLLLYGGGGQNQSFYNNLGKDPSSKSYRLDGVVLNGLHFYPSFPAKREKSSYYHPSANFLLHNLQ